MRNTTTYKYLELFQDIKNQINSNTLTNDSKLESIRSLAKRKNLSTTTVEKAYLQLLVEGYIYSKPKSGYYVSKIDNIESQDFNSRFDPISTKSFQNNALTEDMFDMKQYKSITNKVFNYYQSELLRECSPNGEEILREEIRKYVLKERDVVCDISQIIIGPGIQNLLHILLSLRDYETLSYLSPGFQKALNMFSLKGYQLFSHKKISDIIQSRTDYLYISPSNIYPTGETLRIQDRVQLIKWAQSNNSYIIEDDYNFFIKYNNYTVPSIHSLDQSRVIYMGSFSKTLLPSMRISFMILPIYFYEIYKMQYQTYSQGVSKLEQLSLALYFQEGLFYRHTRKMYNIYKKKNECFRLSMKKFIDQGRISLEGTDSNLHAIIKFRSIEDRSYFVNSCKTKNYKFSLIEKQNGILFPYSGIKNNEMDSILKSLFK